MEDGAVASDSSGGVPEPLALPAEDPKAAAAAGRAEIDTSAPFLSVREAVDRFGGSAVWKSQLWQLFQPEKLHCSEDVEVIKMEEQAAQLEKDLILKERETLDVLKELEMTKKIVDGLKLKLQKETSEVNKIPATNSDGIYSITEAEEHAPTDLEKNVGMDDPSAGENQSPGLILMELKQAKANLNRTTTDLAGIRTSIKMLNVKIEEEKLLLEKTQEKLTSNAALITSLEEDLHQTTATLQRAKDLESEKSEDPTNILQEIKKINSEIEQSRKMMEADKVEVAMLTSDIEHTKVSIKTAEIRWLAAKKMEAAAKAAEAAALADIKALMSSDNSIIDLQSTCCVTLSIEEYIILASKAQEADQNSSKEVEAAMLQVDEANMSKSELPMRVDEATAEAKNCKKALEDALKRVEVANRGKLEVEDALRRWRSDGQRRRSVHNPTTKFKNYAAHHKKDSRVLDLNALVPITDVPSCGFRAPPSIGQILSMKLMGSPEECERGVWEKENEKPTVSLGQMLNRRQHGVVPSRRRTNDGSPHRQFSAKRKKLGFVGLPLLLAKQSKKNKKRQSLSTR